MGFLSRFSRDEFDDTEFEDEFDLSNAALKRSHSVGALLRQARQGFGRDVGQIDDRRGADSHRNRYGFAEFFLGGTVFQRLLDVSFQTSLAMGSQGRSDRDQFLGFSIKNGGFVSFLIKLEIDLPHPRIDHGV